MSQDQDSKKPTQHKSFRFDVESNDKLKEIAALFGRSETAMMREIIDTYYERRKEFFELDSAKRLETANLKNPLK